MSAQMLCVQDSRRVELSTAVEKNQKGQDFPILGTTASGKKFIGVFDGHGSDAVIFAIRNMHRDGILDSMMDQENPVQLIQKKLIDDDVCKKNDSFKAKMSGSTMTGAILEGNTLKIVNCGDSRTFVFRNGTLEFATVEHFAGNLAEREISPYKFLSAVNFKTVSETELEQTPADYVIVTDSENKSYHLALTRALGHNGLVNPVPDIHTLILDPTDEIVVVSMSDGGTDMLICDEENQDNIREEDIRMIYELSSEDLKNKIQERWGQTWRVKLLSGKTVEQRWNKWDFDDVGVARMVIHPQDTRA